MLPCPSPPRWAHRLLTWLHPADTLEEVEGDLAELYAYWHQRTGKTQATLRYLLDVLSVLPPFVRKRQRKQEEYRQPSIFHPDMLRNYFKIAWRNLLNRKVSTLINLLGLTLGTTACLVIYLIVSFELSYDAFHPDKERIYRIMGDVTESTGDKLHFNRVPLPVSRVVRAEVSGVAETAGIVPYNAPITIPGRSKSEGHFESRLGDSHFLTTVIAEPQYFSIFQYNWLVGNPVTALNAPFSVVLTESRARQYFGTAPLNQLLGKPVIYNDSLLVRVSGIVKDWEENTDLAFTDFISFNTLQSRFLRNSISLDSWKQDDMTTWVFGKLVEKTAPNQVNDQLVTLVRKYADSSTKLALRLEPLSAMHVNADVIENPIRTAHLPTLYGLMGIAAFILVLAIINFINLSTAQSIQRAKEVGVRKVLGSSRLRLIFQFLLETLILTVVSILLAVMLVNPVLNGFRSFMPAGVSFPFFQPSIYIFLALICLITTVFAGLYPAKVLSSFLPAVSLKGARMQRGGQNWLLRKGLMVFQFVVSLVFIIGSIVITSQLRYTREKDLGFKADAIITVETPRGDSLPKIAVLVQKIKQIPNVSGVALQWLSPMTDNPRGMKLKLKSTDIKDFWVTQVAGDEAFIPLYKINVLAGRNLVRADSVTELVINENLLKIMGLTNPNDALNKQLYWNDKPYPIVGVVADFHTSSLHDPITPLCIINRPDREGTLAIKLASTGQQSSQIGATLAQVGKAWKEIYPAETFPYRFYDESLALLYEKDQRAALLVNVAMAIAIFISCIGLFGLSLFIAQTKAKEISIRKIVGASVGSIVALLSKDFLKLVLIAIIIASPIAWYAMNRWLQDFAYKIAIEWWMFALAGLLAVGIALLTVGFQSIRAALMNPVKSLQSE